MKILTDTLFQGDLLSVLERLPDNLVSLIYFDPPFFSGNFHDFIFNKEDVEENFQKYNEFLMKSSQQMHRILKDDGCLFLHWWADTKQADIRLILGQVFRNMPVREFFIPQNVKFGSNRRTKALETILVYAKGEKFTMNQVFRSLTADELLKLPKGKDNRGSFVLVSLFSNSLRPAMIFDWNGYSPPKGWSWKHSKTILDELYIKGEIQLSSVNPPKLKQYLNDVKILVGDFWDDLNTNSRDLFVERILKFGSNENDLVLFPGVLPSFCSASDRLKRRWIVIVPNEELVKAYTEALKESCSVDYSVILEDQVLTNPVISQNYNSVIFNINQVIELQSKVNELNKKIIEIKQEKSLKSKGLETILFAMEERIDKSSILEDPDLKNKYIEIAKKWLIDWTKLEELTKEFIPSGELLLDFFHQTQINDYSPFVLQYCRGLENEILMKLFSSYNDDFNGRIKNVDEFLADDITIDNKTKIFATRLKSSNKRYSLGEMLYILKMLNPISKTFQRSKLLQDFKDFTLTYFNEEILDSSYLQQIDTITNDFRNKAAHPSLLDLNLALDCQKAVQKCINSFILNYKKTNPK